MHSAFPARLGVGLLLCLCCLLSPALASSACPDGPTSGDTCAGSSSSLSTGAVHDPYTPPSIAGSDDPSAPPPNVMHMWTTPLFIARPKLRHPAAFNRALSERAMAAFDQLVARDQLATQSAGERGDHAQGVNERFFQWQRDQHAMGNKAEAAYLALSTSSEFQSLQHLFHSYTVGFLQSLGKDADQHLSPKDQAAMFCWATVAAGGNYHLSHTHPSNMLSGAYYSRIPRDAGTIIFDDPRGPRWPFEGRYIHTPAAGDLVLFPSWLVHQVTPTQGDERRISWSCNVPGSWEDLADVNLV